MDEVKCNVKKERKKKSGHELFTGSMDYASYVPVMGITGSVAGQLKEITELITAKMAFNILEDNGAMRKEDKSKGF